MLLLECIKCQGEGSWTECEACQDGYVEAPADMKVFVNVYKITRHFGGHEEGGWYYNSFECLEVVPTKNKFSDEIKEDLEKEYSHIKHGNIYSVLGGADVLVAIQEKRSESHDVNRPIYE